VIDFELFWPELDTDDSKEQLAPLQKLTERYCILYRTLSNPPQVSVSYTT
jgi:hypothetical protein